MIHTEIFLKHIKITKFLLGLFLLGFLIIQAVFAFPGDPCVLDSDCGVEEACVEDVCCVDLGGGCSGDSNCCSNFCHIDSNTCQFCIGNGLSCDSDNECCTGNCLGGVCALEGETGWEKCASEAGDCILFTQNLTCDNGTKITLNYTPGGCGSCNLSFDPTPWQTSRCCIDNPTRCLYSCHHEALTGITGCEDVVPGAQCEKHWSTDGPCSGFCVPFCPNSDTYCPGLEPDDGCDNTCPVGTKIDGCEVPCSISQCITEGHSNTTVAICTGGGSSCSNLLGSFSVDSSVCTNSSCDCCGPSGPVCGDGTCDPEETCTTCPSDCGVCLGSCSLSYCQTLWSDTTSAFCGTYLDCGGDEYLGRRESSDCNVIFGLYCNCCKLNPISVGYISIMSNTGIIKLDLISSADAELLDRGVIKVARFVGDKGTVAHLVETNDPLASPVRVRTPHGIKAWRINN